MSEPVEDAAFQLLTREHVADLSKFAIANVPDPYNDYSRFGSMSVVETKTGERYAGISIENAALSLSKHSEEVAVIQAIMDGAIGRCGTRFIDVIYLSTFVGPAAPCGACRQFISEFSDAETLWVGHNIKTGEVKMSHFFDLLPLPFTPSHLK